MIAKAREVRLKPKERKVLEARCRAPTTAQRDVKRERIVLLAAAGRSTRSIAADVGVQPRIVSKWRRRFAERGLAGLRDEPGATKKPIYGKATNKRILALLDKPPRFHRSLQQDCPAIRLDQEEGPPAAVQKSPYHSTLIPGTSRETYPPCVCLIDAQHIVFASLA